MAFSAPRLAAPALAIFFTLLGLGLAEVVVRGLERAPALKPIDLDAGESVYQRSTNPVLAFELKANYRNDRPDYIQSYRRTNAHGQRDLERTLEKPPGVRRVLVLGDSVVEGIGLRDLDDTISRQLEKLYPDGRTEVLNFGVSAYCTLAEVELLEVKGLAFDPDVVILVFVENDYLNFNREAFELGGAFDRPAIVQALFRRSHLFRLVAVRLNLFHFGVESDPLSWNRRAIGDNNVVDGLRRLAQLAEKHDFAPIVAIWPLFTDSAVVDTDFMPDGSGDLVIERLAAMVGIPTHRLSESFSAHLESGGPAVNPRLRLTVEGDAMHPNPEAAAVAARALFAALAESIGSRPELRAAANDPEAVEAARLLGGVAPSYARVHYNQGQTAQAAGRLDEAIAHYRKALEADPAFALAHYNLAVAFESQGVLNEAESHYRAALRARPTYGKAHNNLAALLQEQGRSDEALEHYREAMRLLPDHPTIRKNYEAAVRRRAGRAD